MLVQTCPDKQIVKSFMPEQKESKGIEAICLTIAAIAGILLFVI